MLDRQVPLSCGHTNDAETEKLPITSFCSVNPEYHNLRIVLDHTMRAVVYYLICITKLVIRQQAATTQGRRRRRPPFAPPDKLVRICLL
jgi:hypothetical protein